MHIAHLLVVIATVGVYQCQNVIYWHTKGTPKISEREIVKDDQVRWKVSRNGKEKRT